MPGSSLDDACSVLRASEPSPLPLSEAFETCFDAIGEEGMMGGLPRSQDAVPVELAGPGHEAALRKRLKRLGYMASSRGSRAALDAGIRLFQKEAGLVVDGWTGARTWDALQELFSFEHPLAMRRWLDESGKLGPALRRALRLRLTAYGQWNRPEDGGHPGLLRAFARWLHNARRMGYEPEADDDEITVDRVGRLFAHDAIIEHLTRRPERCQPAHYGAEAGELRHQLLCLAKVELWMNGYPVAPDGKTDLTTRKRLDLQNLGGKRRAPRRVVSKTDFFKVVESFLEDTQGDGVQIPAAIHRSRNDDERLDHAVAAILIRTREMGAEGKQAPAMGDEELARLVLRQDDPKRFWRRLADTVKSLATSLFDGVKRVWRWLREKIGRVVNWARESLVNLARAVWNRLTEIGRLVRAGFSAFVSGVRFFVRPTLAFSDPESVVMAHELDFDFRVFVDHAADAETVGDKLKELARLSKAWKIACEIIGLVTTAARAALRGTSGFGLLFVASSLLQMGQQLKALGDLLSAYISLDFADPFGG